MVFRDGVGGPHCEARVIMNEGPNGPLQRAIKEWSQNYNPKILYILLKKHCNIRFFEKSQNNYFNPAPGTVVDSVIVENDGQ